MASFPLYDTFFFIIILPRKVHYLFSYFEKSGKKMGHPQKSCLTPPLRGGGGGGFSPDFCENKILRYELAMMARTCTNNSRVGGGGGFSPDFFKNTILRYELAMMARTCINNLRVVFSPYVQHCPCEASEQKWSQKTNI